MRKLFFLFMMAFMSVYGNWEPSQPLLDLLEAMEVSHDGTLSSIVEATQKKWIRPAGKERWEIADLSAKEREKVIFHAERLGFFQERWPERKEYEYVLLLGATVFRMQKRIETMIRLWESGVRFHQIVILTGDRKLDPRVEALTEICETESEAAKALWKLAPIPDDMAAVPVIFIASPMIETGGIKRRPATGDTISSWLSTHPKEGSCLFISNQPYCLYQDAVVRKMMPKGYFIETVGDEAEGSRQSAAVILDTIARWLYAQAS